jgi:GNAT superfamily N-acetyltransferase
VTSPAANYPKDLPLRDALTVSIRPLAAGDEDALLAFFGDIPEHERFFLKDDVTSPDLIRGWIADAERPDPEPGPTARTAGRAFVLIAIDDSRPDGRPSGRVVGEAALVRRRGKARSHLADVRVVVAQDVRHHGLGTALISELCDVARDTGLSGVLFEAVEEAQAEALAAAEALGFTRLGRVYGGAIDPEGRLHDVVLLAMPMRRWRTASYF